MLGWYSALGIGLGTGIMIAVSAAGPASAVVQAPHPPAGPPWWLSLSLPEWPVTLLLGLAMLAGAGGVACGLAAVRRGARPPARLLAGIAIALCAVFAVLPAAGSSDTLDYAAYGRIVVLRHNPYQMSPLQLRRSADPVGRDAPHAWQTARSAYGPLATAEQAAAAALGGTVTARIIFWLKLWNALAFGLVVLVLDRLLRADPARRARAHLLWSLNPVLLWSLLAAGHVDTVAAACGLLAVVSAWPGRGPAGPRLARFLAAGALAGAAADFKINYAVFGAGVAWAARRSPAALLTAALGALAMLVPSYLWAGPRAVTVLLQHPDATADTFYALFSHSLSYPHLAEVLLLIVPACLVLAAALWRRLPAADVRWPALLPAFALAVAWIVAWPYQRPWYDAVVFCLLALYPATRLDWVLLGQLAVTSLEDLPGMPGYPSPSSLLASVQAQLVSTWVPLTRLAVLAAVVALCVTGAWWPRGPAGGMTTVSARTTRGARA